VGGGERKRAETGHTRPERLHRRRSVVPIHSTPTT
jgi:hypothetical protein